MITSLCSALQTSNQEIFDHVIPLLIEQGESASAPSKLDTCLYRTEDGKKCAVGLLLSDLEYKQVEAKRLNASSAPTLIDELGLYETRVASVSAHFLPRLQKCHDGARWETDKQKWRERVGFDLRALATNFDLNQDVLNATLEKYDVVV